MSLHRIESQDGLIHIVDGPYDALEICPVCFLQGVIAAIHDPLIKHSGSEYFKLWKPTAQFYRDMAKRVEKGEIKP